MYGGEVFLVNVCISFNGDLKLHVNMPKRRIHPSTRGNALSSCENTMRFHDMESTRFLFFVRPSFSRSLLKDAIVQKSRGKSINIQCILSHFSSLRLHLQRKIMPRILL